MATFNFASITAAQALSLTADDMVLVDQGSANATTIQFGTTTTSMTVGATTVVFSQALSRATTTFADGSRLYVGSGGNDSPAAFGAENNGLYGGSGADTLNAGDGTNQLQGNQGEDRLVGGAGFDVIYGGQDNDTIFVGQSATGGGLNFAQGNRGQDTINGSATDNDTLLGGLDNDVIGVAGLGISNILGRATVYLDPIGATGGGNDFVNGNLGNDYIYTGSGDDTVNGEDGSDQIFDTGGRNVFNGGNGEDYFKVAGQSTIIGGAGDDLVNPQAGIFFVDLGDGSDGLFALINNETTDRFTVDCGDGEDVVRTGNGPDSISGGAGNDAILAWGGSDTISGGDGADEFDFYGGQESTNFADLDIILDWSSSDFLYFQDLSSSAIVGTGSSTNYSENTAANYAAALALANDRIAAGLIQYVVVQVGADVFVFADAQCNDGVADVAVRLIGRSLDDISMTNFLGI